MILLKKIVSYEWKSLLPFLRSYHQSNPAANF